MRDFSVPQILNSKLKNVNETSVESHVSMVTGDQTTETTLQKTMFHEPSWNTTYHPKCTLNRFRAPSTKDTMLHFGVVIFNYCSSGVG